MKAILVLFGATHGAGRGASNDFDVADGDGGAGRFFGERVLAVKGADVVEEFEGFKGVAGAEEGVDCFHGDVDCVVAHDCVR